jgi:ketosteroid isomerase-like protein
MDVESMLRKAYAAFNARDIDGALAMMHADVVWPNGMEGGWVHGRDGVRAYWTRQWSLVDPRVEVLGIVQEEDGRHVAEVNQVVRDLHGRVIAERIVHHAYSIEDGKVISMEIGE